MAWSLVLSIGLWVPSAANADEASATLTIEDLPALTLNASSPTDHYLAFTNLDFQKISVTLESHQRVVLDLTYADPSLSGSVATWEYNLPWGPVLSQDLSLWCVDPGPVQRPETDPTCNLFELEVELTQGGALPPLIFNLHLLRRYAPDATPAIDIEWQPEDLGEFRQSFTRAQGWYRLPESPNPSFTQLRYWDSMIEFEDFASYNNDPGGQTFTLGEYFPVFTDATFYAVWENNGPPIIEIFDNVLAPFRCPAPAEQELCLYMVFTAYQYPEAQVFSEAANTDEYFLSFWTHYDFEDRTDDEDQQIKVSWPLDSTNRTVTLSHQDHRVVNDYGTPLEFTDDPNPETLDNTSRNLPDDWICDLEQPCKRVWDLDISFTDNQNRAQTFNLNLIVFDSSLPLPLFDFDFYPDHPSEFDGADVPNNYEWDFEQRLTLWVEAPSTFPDPEIQPQDGVTLTYGAKPNNHFAGWSTLSNQVGETFSKPYFPLVQNEVLYWVWKPIYNVTFYDGNEVVDQSETWGDRTISELAPELPAGARGWGLSTGGSVQSGDYQIDSEINLYAIYPPRNLGGGGGFVPPAAEPTPEPSTTPDTQLPTTKTTVKITYENGVTTILATIPPGYVNRPTRVEKRLVVGGKLRYSVLSRAWTHYDKVTRDTSKATMTFKFRGRLKTTDRFRVVVKGITVIKAYGDGKPAWK